eukprot:216656_1
MTVEKETETYYSFGTKYRYTKNLKKHPFYVKPKFETLKDELREYFIRNEKQMLLEKQIKTIKSFPFIPTNVQTILTSYVKTSLFTEINSKIQIDRESCMEFFWMDKTKNKYDTSTIQSLLSIEENGFQQLNSIITELCRNWDEVTVSINLSTLVFITLLETMQKAHDELIRTCSMNYIKRIVVDWNITDCDEHKSYSNECDECFARSVVKNVNAYVDNSSKSISKEHSKLNDVVKDALCICAIAANANDNLKEYSELNEIQRVKFQENITTFLKNEDNKKQLSESLIWKNQPSSIADCNTDHIVWIIQNDLLHHIKTNYPDLIKYKKNIIQYIQQEKFDGKKLKQQITGKEFAAKIVNDSNKSKEALTELYTLLIEYDTSQVDTFKLVGDFYGSMFAISIQQLHGLPIFKDYKTVEILTPMLPYIETWIDSEELPELEVISQDEYKVNTKQLIEFIKERFSVDLQQQLPINEIKWQFTEFALKLITETLDSYNTNYIENTKPTINSNIKQLITKSQTKMDQASVKEYKATWYQGINEFHEIKLNAPMRENHVLALIVYTQCTELCTVFRGTYRQNCIDEPMNNQIQRHSEFANFARLLYESFVFYGSIDAG